MAQPKVMSQTIDAKGTTSFLPIYTTKKSTWLDIGVHGVKSPANAVKLLIIVANPRGFAKHMPHLQQLGYKIDLTSNTMMAANASDGDWDAVLISYNLVKEDVVGLYKKVEKMQIPCMVFPEDNTRRSANALLKSKIPNVMFPPITSLGIHRRLEMLLRSKRKASKGAGFSREHVDTKVSGGEDHTEIPWWERSQFQGKLEDYVTQSLVLLPKPAPSGVAVGPNAQSHAMIARVAWGKVQGYLALAYEDPGVDRSFVNQVRRSLMEQMTAKGISEHDVEEFFEMDIGFVEFQTWVKEYAEVLVSNGDPGQQLLIAFVDTNSLPKVRKLPTADYFSVELEGRLNLNSKLTFDLFFHLPANNRFIRYARKDASVSQDLLDRLMRIGPNRFVLTPSECGNLFRYCIQADLWSQTPAADDSSTSNSDTE